MTSNSTIPQNMRILRSFCCGSNKTKAIASTSFNNLNYFVRRLHHNKNNILLRRISKQCVTPVRHHNFDGEQTYKSNMTLMTKEDETHNYIEAYSIYGFRLTSGFRILGPCALFPKAVLHWSVPSAAQITHDHLSLFCLLEPKPDILVIGKGDWDAPVNTDIIKYLKSKRINVEILPTEQACATFNFLNSERRVVAAGLIPPVTMRDQDEFYPEGGKIDLSSIGDNMEDQAILANRPTKLGYISSSKEDNKNSSPFKRIKERLTEEDHIKEGKEPKKNKQ